MKIRATELKDLPRVMEIYDYARAFMRTNGNVTQWIGVDSSGNRRRP